MAYIPVGLGVGPCPLRRPPGGQRAPRSLVLIIGLLSLIVSWVTVRGGGVERV